MSEERKKEGINIELTEEIAQGNYSNLAIINHSQSEFVVDFVQMMPGIKKAKGKIKNYFDTSTCKKINEGFSR